LGETEKASKRRKRRQDLVSVNLGEKNGSEDKVGKKQKKRGKKKKKGGRKNKSRAAMKGRNVPKRL